MARVSQAKRGLAQLQGVIARSGVVVPEDVHTANDLFATEMKTFSQTIQAGNNDAATQSLQTMEDRVTLIEKFVVDTRAASGASPAPTQTPPSARPTFGRRAASPDQEAQAELLKRYRAVMLRTEKDRGQLLRLERTQGDTVPADVRTAQDQLRKQENAVVTAWRKHDPAEMDQAAQSLEDSLTVIEKYLAK
jgi:hypothetical protein